MAMESSIDLDSDRRALIGRRVFDAPRDLVWSAFTDPDRLAQWWGPHGFTITTSAFDMRPGGTWRFVMHGPDGRDYKNIVVWEEVTPPERLVYRHGGEEETAAIQFRTTVTFDDLGEKTSVEWRAEFATAAELDRVIREHGADTGLVQTMNRLAEFLDRKSGMPRSYASTVEVTETAPNEVTVKRAFDASRHKVFEAYTKPDIVMRWLYGPDDWPMVECAIDLRVGGKLRYVWRNETRGDMGLSGIFREISAPFRLVHTELFDHDWTGGETLVTIDFTEAGRRTVVSTTVQYASRQARDAALKTGMIEGWSHGLARLNELLTARAA